MGNPTHESVVKFFGNNDVDDFKVTLTISKKVVMLLPAKT